MSIIIFSGEIRSGKTTALSNWCQLQQNVHGILMPDMNGVRWMKNIRTGETWVVECSSPDMTNEALIGVGRFSFYQSAFDKANNVINHAASIQPSYIIIDEVGKLELEREGLYASVRTAVENSENYTLILVVRNSLVNVVMKSFDISGCNVVTELENIF